MANESGWAWPRNSKKAHYFVNGRALCGKWAWFGDVDTTEADKHSTNDCAACRKKFDKHHKPTAVQSESPASEEKRG